MTTRTMEQSETASGEGVYGFQNHGLNPTKDVHYNLSPAQLYEASFAKGDGQLVHMGAIAAVTAPHTGRSPNDRFVVRDENSEGVVDWGKVNVPVSPEHFAALRTDVVAYLNDHEIYVQDARAGEDATHGINVRVISESAWHSLFAYNMFLRLSAEERVDFVPGFTVLHAPHLKADPARHGVNSETAIMVNFTA
ncbi:MAG: phosphoenolpyruvate carboxykinase (ATP), partial [Gemmatimonadales bacterium]|nr:phosphoenolpyruvate carboxykinase (ATP) [Gemmatimonadales bacterium]